ncbi:hypothetical protein OAJ14_03625 [Polaribacter sp.]|nr:hypothetical protein [Polaribacter sp.]
MRKKIPNYIKFIFTHVFFLFVYLFVFRILFYILFAQLEEAATSEIQKAFSLGMRFDLKLASITFFPLAILILIVNYRFLQRTFY